MAAGAVAFTATSGSVAVASAAAATAGVSVAWVSFLVYWSFFLLMVVVAVWTNLVIRRTNGEVVVVPSGVVVVVPSGLVVVAVVVSIHA